MYVCMYKDDLDAYLGLSERARPLTLSLVHLVGQIVRRPSLGCVSADV